MPAFCRIFLSYRREETRHLAGRLADRLTAQFGPNQVFMDVDRIRPGDNVSEEIVAAVTSCDVLLAMIGPAWLTITDTRGYRRLDDPADFVRQEIAAALDRRVLVIPILADGADMPSRDELPAQLAPLALRHAVRLDHESFSSDIHRLLEVLGRPPETPAQQASHGAESSNIQPVARLEAPPDSRNRIDSYASQSILRSLLWWMAFALAAAIGLGLGAALRRGFSYAGPLLTACPALLAVALLVIWVLVRKHRQLLGRLASNGSPNPALARELRAVSAARIRKISIALAALAATGIAGIIADLTVLRT